jgi:hypothetical protein
MSTSYFMACEQCKERYLIGQDGWKFFTFYSGEPDCMKGIGDFIGRHVLCGGTLQVLPESRVEELVEIEWSKP